MCILGVDGLIKGVGELAVFSRSAVDVYIGTHSVSFPQAPSNMKSVLQAGWLLTVAIGNFIVLIVAGAGSFSEQVLVQTEIARTSVFSPVNHHRDDPP